MSRKYHYYKIFMVNRFNLEKYYLNVRIFVVRNAYLLANYNAQSFFKNNKCISVATSYITFKRTKIDSKLYYTGISMY